MPSTVIPLSILFRLPKYYNILNLKKQSGCVWTTSLEMANALDLTSSTVRKDLSYLDFQGHRRKGYDVEELSDSLYDILTNAGGVQVAILGAGNLGRAIAKHREFISRGFTICAFFDSDPLLQADTISGVVIYSPDKIDEVIKEFNVQIGIIAVPANAAQVSADRLVAAGVSGILNLTTTHLKVPKITAVVDFSLVAGLLQLSCSINMQRKTAMIQ